MSFANFDNVMTRDKLVCLPAETWLVMRPALANRMKPLMEEGDAATAAVSIPLAE